MQQQATVVKDLIVPLDQYPHVGSEEPVHNAVTQLFSHTVNDSDKLLFDELLVINNNNQLVGRLTIQGILTCYFPTLFTSGQQKIFAGKQEVFTDLAILLEDRFQAECKRQGTKPVSQFMVPPHRSVKTDLHPLHAAEIMMEEKETSLPVVENQVLIGVIRLTDVFRMLASSCSI